MVVSAQVAIYPLRQDRLTPAITAVRRAFEAAGLGPAVGPMSTLVTGEATGTRWPRPFESRVRACSWRL